MQPAQPQQPKDLSAKNPQKPEPKPPQPAPAGPTPTLRRNLNRRTTFLLGAVAAVLAAGSLTIWAVTRDARPRLNDDTESIVRFVTTKDYQRLPFAQKAEYMMVLEDRDDNDELKDLFNAGRISEGDYRAAMEEAWLGQQYKRSQKFASLAPGMPRVRYVRELVEKKLQKDARKAAKPNANKSKNDEPSDAVKRDESTEEARIAEWPADARMKWEQFRMAYKAEKEAREAAVEQNTARSADTQVPASR